MCKHCVVESNTRPVSEMEEDCKDQGADVPAILPLHREAGQCSPSESRKYSTVTPIKQSLPQPNFDDEDVSWFCTRAGIFMVYSLLILFFPVVFLNLHSKISLNQHFRRVM